MLALHDAVRYGDRLKLARLVEVAHATGGRLATALAAHAAAVTDRNADAIYAAAQHLEQIGALLLAADAAAQAATAYQAADDRRHGGVAAGTEPSGRRLRRASHPRIGPRRQSAPAADRTPD